MSFHVHEYEYKTSDVVEYWDPRHDKSFLAKVVRVGLSKEDFWGSEYEEIVDSLPGVFDAYVLERYEDEARIIIPFKYSTLFGYRILLKYGVEDEQGNIVFEKVR